MDYEKLWNQLKQDQLDRINRASHDNATREPFRILKRMCEAEVKAYFNTRCEDKNIVHVDKLEEA